MMAQTDVGNAPLNAFERDPTLLGRRSTVITEAGAWKNFVVLCAANRYDGIKLADQHMAEHLAQHVPVLYIDPPLSLLRVFGKRQISLRPKLQVLGPQLVRLTPVVQPFHSRAWIAPLTSMLVRRSVRWAIRQLAGEVQAVVSAWPQFPVFGICDERLRIYWAQDDFVGGAALMRLDPHMLHAREQQTAAAANMIVAANPGVAETWRARGYEPRLIPFGADIDLYEGVDQLTPALDVKLPSPIVGLIGQINERIDISLLEAIADRGRSLLLIGPRNPNYEPARWEALLKRSNVQWLGPRRYEQLPAYMRTIDVGLVPYNDSAFNRGSFPLKTLEYLAAGRPVVSTSLPATRWLATNLISIADEPTAFADAVDHWLDAPRTKELGEARREFAKRHSWAQRAKEMAEIINVTSSHAGPARLKPI
jgi:glycosyltransferase involved in cell wall biosynthesis